MADLKVYIDKLEDGGNWYKWKWQMKMHFEWHDLTLIIDGTRLCQVMPKPLQMTT